MSTNEERINSLAIEYFMMFNEYPPILTTLSVEDDKYYKLVTEAIMNKKKLTEDDLADAVGTYDIDYDTKEEFDSDNDFENWEN